MPWEWLYIKRLRYLSTSETDAAPWRTRCTAAAEFNTSKCTSSSTFAGTWCLILDGTCAARGAPCRAIDSVVACESAAFALALADGPGSQLTASGVTPVRDSETSRPIVQILINESTWHARRTVVIRMTASRNALVHALHSIQCLKKNPNATGGAASRQTPGMRMRRCKHQRAARWMLCQVDNEA